MKVNRYSSQEGRLAGKMKEQAGRQQGRQTVMKADRHAGMQVVRKAGRQARYKC